MIELFELIASKPLEFLAGLGISTTTIYAVIRALKGVVGLITKKSTQAKELLNRENIANAVITKLGGLDIFIDSIANAVIDKITNDKTIISFKNELEKMANSSHCPVELKAYINTVLTQSGNEQLALLYEQAKNTLILMTNDKVEQTIEKGENTLENANISEIEPIIKTMAVAPTPTATVKETKKSKKDKKKVNEPTGDVSYA